MQFQNTVNLIQTDTNQFSMIEFSEKWLSKIIFSQKIKKKVFDKKFGKKISKKKFERKYRKKILNDSTHQDL